MPKKSTVNKAGNYTKPTMRKQLFQKIKSGSKGGKPGQWSARKAQLLASEYKKKVAGIETNGTQETTEEPETMDKTKMANEVGKAFFENRGEISSRKSNQESDICRICGNNKSEAKRNKAGQTVCEATQAYCKKNESIP